MSETKVFLIALFSLMCVALAMTRIIDFVVGPQPVACTITFSDAGGNRHQFVGKGEVW